MLQATLQANLEVYYVMLGYTYLVGLLQGPGVNLVYGLWSPMLATPGYAYLSVYYVRLQSGWGTFRRQGSSAVGTPPTDVTAAMSACLNNVPAKTGSQATLNSHS
jgi:hypothetical protein